MNNLNELLVLRNEKRSTLAKKVLKIIDFCNDNNFQYLLKTKSVCFSNANGGQYEQVLIIRDDYDSNIGIGIDFYSDADKEYKLQVIRNSIVCNSEKRKQFGYYDYNCSGWYASKMKEVKKWIEEMKKKIETSIEKEIEWLSNWNTI